MYSSFVDFQMTTTLPRQEARAEKSRMAEGKYLGKKRHHDNGFGKLLSLAGRLVIDWL